MNTRTSGRRVSMSISVSSGYVTPHMVLHPAARGERNAAPGGDVPTRGSAYGVDIDHHLHRPGHSE
ncbi:hypothetical protein, partial [Streptomyces sp. NRRL F-5630]